VGAFRRRPRCLAEQRTHVTSKFNEMPCECVRACMHAWHDSREIPFDDASTKKITTSRNSPEQESMSYPRKNTSRSQAIQPAQRKGRIAARRRNKHWKLSKRTKRVGLNVGTPDETHTTHPNPTLFSPHVHKNQKRETEVGRPTRTRRRRRASARLLFFLARHATRWSMKQAALHNRRWLQILLYLVLI
jgi:hypothetical protein